MKKPLAGSYKTRRALADALLDDQVSALTAAGMGAAQAERIALDSGSADVIVENPDGTFSLWAAKGQVLTPTPEALERSRIANGE